MVVLRAVTVLGPLALVVVRIVVVGEPTGVSSVTVQLVPAGMPVRACDPPWESENVIGLAEKPSAMIVSVAPPWVNVHTTEKLNGPGRVAVPLPFTALVLTALLTVSRA
jgi:hypothetical protein